MNVTAPQCGHEDWMGSFDSLPQAFKAASRLYHLRKVLLIPNMCSGCKRIRLVEPTKEAV